MMKQFRNRPARLVWLAGAALAATSATLAHAQVDRPETRSASTSIDVFEQATMLQADGRLIEARDVLVVLLKENGTSLSDRETDQAYTVLARLNRRIQNLDANEVSTQKAELALKKDQLSTAERHANAVLASRSAGQGQRERAEFVIERAGVRQSDLSANASAALESAIASFNATDYASAKTALDAISRSGVQLPASEKAELDRYQARIVDLEVRRGELFESETVSLGMYQPGVVKRNQQPSQPAQSEPTPQGEPAEAQPVSQSRRSQPAQLPPGVEEIDPSQDLTPTPIPESERPQPEPTYQPSTPPPPAPAPAGGDLIGEARQSEALTLLGEADIAFAERRLNEAGQKYARVLDRYGSFLTGDQTSHAEQRLAEVRLLQRGSSPTGDLLSQANETRSLAKQQAVAEFENEVDQSERALSSGDTSRARDLAVRARLRLASARRLFSEPEFEDYNARVDGLLEQIDKTESELRIAEQVRQTKMLEQQQATAEQQRELEKSRKIQEHLKRVRALQMDHRYEEALEVVDQILFLDPIDPAGLLLKEVLFNAMIYKTYNEIDAERKQSYSFQAMQNLQASIAPDEIINYPSDWPAISLRRGEAGAFDEPVENRRVLSLIETKRLPSVAFQDNALVDVLGFVEEVSQVNMDVDWQSLEEISIDQETPVTLNLTNVPIQTLLERVLEKASAEGFGEPAGWAVTDGILTVASEEVLRRNTTLHIYDVRDLVVEVPDYAEAPEIDLQQVLSSSQGGGGQSPFRDDQQDDRDRLPLDERIQEIVDIIQTNIDFDGWQDNGGDTGFIQRLGGNLIITNTPRNHREINGLLSKLRAVRAMQINVETRFLLVSQDFFEQIGFDLDVYINTDNNQVRAARAVDPTIQGSDFFEFNPNNLPAGQGGTGLLRSVQGAGVAVDTNGDTVPDSFTGSQGVVNPRPWSPVAFSQNSFGITNSLAPQEGIASTILGLSPALGIAGQFLDDVQVDFLIEATQADRRSIQLTAPRLTFTNGQTANFWVATQQAFVSDLQPVVSDSAVGFDPTIDVVSEGVTMIVEGTVSADRRYVMMNVDAAVAQIDGFAQQAVTAVAGGQLVSSADTASFVQLPTLTVTRVQTTVTVPDQGTILLGGQRLVNETEVESGVPVLSKIPVLNRFFSNRIEVKEESTLLILIKPTVLIQNEEENRQYPGLLDQIGGGFGG